MIVDIVVVVVFTIVIAIPIFNNDIIVIALVDVVVILKHQSVYFAVVPDLYFWEKMKKKNSLVKIEWYF